MEEKVVFLDLGGLPVGYSQAVITALRFLHKKYPSVRFIISEKTKHIASDISVEMYDYCEFRFFRTYSSVKDAQAGKARKCFLEEQKVSTNSNKYFLDVLNIFSTVNEVKVLITYSRDGGGKFLNIAKKKCYFIENFDDFVSFRIFPGQVRGVLCFNFLKAENNSLKDFLNCIVIGKLMYNFFVQKESYTKIPFRVALLGTEIPSEYKKRMQQIGFFLSSNSSVLGIEYVGLLSPNEINSEDIHILLGDGSVCDIFFSTFQKTIDYIDFFVEKHSSRNFFLLNLKRLIGLEITKENLFGTEKRVFFDYQIISGIKNKNIFLGPSNKIYSSDAFITIIDLAIRVSLDNMCYHDMFTNNKLKLPYK